MPSLLPISRRRSVALSHFVARVLPGIVAGVLLLLPSHVFASVTFSGNQVIRSGLVGASNVLAADLDGDGVPDVVGIGDEVVYALNGGDGSTWTPVDLAGNPGRARQLAVADIDGDDDLDVLYTDYDDDKVYRFFNNLGTTGTFSGRGTVVNLNWADGIAAGDLDGDGDADLAVTSRQGDTYYWIENANGAGTSWTLHAIQNFLDGAQLVAIGDIDQDGDLDLVGGGAEDTPKLVWFENTAGNASEWTTHEIDDSWVNGIAIEDIDLDGDPDIIISENNAGLPASTEDQVVWWENTDGEGGLWSEHVIGGAGSDATDGVQVVDLDQDGDLDVVSSRNGDWFENTDGNATAWTVRSYSTGTNDIDDSDVADFDRDGDLDIVGARLEGQRLDWWENLTCSPTDLDSDGDGAADDCDVCDGFDDFQDADGDTVPDGCDVCSGDDRVDTDGNGTPDPCQATGMLSIGDVAMAEGDTGNTDFVFTVTLTGDVDEAFTVDYATNDGSATLADSDYVAKSGTLGFAGNDGETETFTISVVGDTTPEGDETFLVELDNLSTLSADLADDSAVGTIQEDDATLSLDDVTAIEGDSGTTDYVFTVTLAGGVAGPISVEIDTQDGTATAGTDYTASGATLVFAGTDGETETFTVSVEGDTVLEDDETFDVVLSAVSDPTVGISSTGIGTIQNDDSASIAVDDFTAAEGDSGTSAFVFTVTLTGDVQGGFTVDAVSQDGTATSGSGDYASVAETLSFVGVDGETETVTVQVAGDITVEDDETFTVVLGAPSNGDLAVTDGTGLGTILGNDDTASLAITDVTQVEGDTGSTDFLFVVTLTGGVEGGFTIAAQTQDGTAVAGSDYTAGSETLAFAGTDGETETFTVSVGGDTVLEADETFTAMLGTPSNGDVVVADGTGLGTLDNDDTATLAIDDVTQLEGDAGSSEFMFLVTLTGEVQDGFTVAAQTQDGAAAAGSDYTAASSTLTFAGGDGETELFSVDVGGDTVVEGDETFTVVLGVPSNSALTIGDGTGLGTIENDDTASISINDVTQLEGDAGSTDLVFTVTLSGDVQGGFTAPAQTQDGTATAGSDYTAAASTLAFAGANGETRTFTVGVLGDTVAEPDEDFTAVIGATSNAAVGVTDDTGQANILNDDGDPQGTLNVDLAGTGFATVTSSPAGIDCEPSGGPACSEAFDTGVEIELSVETDSDTVFVGFTGDADCADSRVSFAADGESVTCTANLAPSQPIFAAGFETGDTSEWSQTVGAN